MNTPKEPSLAERVTAFNCFDLPGQPMAMHVGTSRLVNDLAKEVEALTRERDARLAVKIKIESLYEELRKATDGGSESMTHDDALKQIAYWQDKCSQVQVAVPQQDGTCNPHPAAPHGFSRNASHSAGRYVCDCEGWVPDWSAA